MADTEVPEIPLLDNPHAPEVFATVASGFFHLNGNITITFESARLDHSQDPPLVNRVVLARLVMPVSGAQGLVVGLNDFLEKQGLSPTTAILGGAARQ